MSCHRLSACAVALLTLSAPLAAEESVVSTCSASPNVAYDAGLRYAFVADDANGTLAEVSVDGYGITHVPVGPRPTAVISDPVSHRLYIAHDADPPFVTLFDPLWNGAVRHVPVEKGPHDLAADFERGELYVVSREAATLAVIDTQSGDVMATMSVSSEPMAVRVDRAAARVYVMSADGVTTVVDPKARAVVGTLPVSTTFKTPILLSDPLPTSRPARSGNLIATKQYER
jgi:YVTN family beta-propeller protein